MPLHGKNRQIFVSDGLDRAVIRAGKNFKSRAQRIHRLMVRTVDDKSRAVQRAQEAAFGADRVQAVMSVDLAVAFDMLAQRAAEIDVEDLQPAANADDLTPGAKKIVDERKLARVAPLVDICRAVDRLTVKAGVHITPAGKQQSVRALRHFGERGTGQRERFFVIFQACR